MADAVAKPATKVVCTATYPTNVSGALPLWLIANMALALQCALQHKRV